MTFFASLLQIPISTSTKFLVDYLIDFFNFIGIRPSILQFPDVIFFLIIPLAISFFAMFKFISRLRIFRKSNIANYVIAIVIVFLAIRFIFPIIFLISALYLIFIEKWPRSKWGRIGFIIGLIAIYYFAFPILTEFSQQLGL